MTMRQWTQSKLGRDNLKLAQVPRPKPGPGEILVKVAAVSLNFRDRMVIENGMGIDITYPFVPGSDLAGEVAEIGNSVTRFRVGDRVISTFVPGWFDGPCVAPAREPPYNTRGGYYPGVLADYVVQRADELCAAPASVTDGEASTLPVAGLTAWYALVEHGRVTAGQTVVVQGTGGVALFAAQIAAAHGARVLLTSSSDEKLARASAVAPIEGIVRGAGDWAETVLDLTDGRGADQILEMAGGVSLGRSVVAAAAEGRIHLIGIIDAIEISAPTFPLLLKQVAIQGVVVGHRRALEDLVRAIDRVRLKPVIDAVYPMEQLPAALDHLERGPFGKVVVQVA